MNIGRAVIGSAAFAGVALIVLGERVPGCLGPLGVTTAQCAKGMAASGHPFAPGPGSGTVAILALPLAAFLATLIPWKRLDRVGLIASGLAALTASVIGALYYDATRPTSITQTNEFSGQTDTAPLAANADLRILTALLAAAVVGVSASWLLALVQWRRVGD